MNEKKKSIYILAGLILFGAALTSTHDGEFWPYSIYPMFSSAKNTWYRSLVRDVTDSDFNYNDVFDRESLPGKPIAIIDTDIHQNDLSNFMSKTEVWDQNSLNIVSEYFKTERQTKNLIVYNVEGSLPNDSLVIRYIPKIYISKDTTIYLQ